MLAEFIVGTALECIGDDETRVEWDAYDLECGDISIEVKSTALLQSWGHATSAPRFGIAKTRAWDPQTRTYADECKRQADVYVFCYFGESDRSANPLDVSKWEFYVASAKTLNSKFDEQKEVALSRLADTAGVIKCDFERLRPAVKAVTEK